MSESEKKQSTDVATVPVKRSEVTSFNPDQPSSLFMVTSVFEQLQRVASLMANSQMIPKHLQGQVADCFLVASQAVQWKMNPFAVAQSCYVLQGKLGYEGKLIAAVVNAHLRRDGSAGLCYEYSGKGQDRQVRVFATLKGEEKPREVIGTVSYWKTVNKQWETQTDQMLAYRGAREWARRHTPEVLLGVYAEEELPQVVASQVVDVTPASLDDLIGTVVEAKNDGERPKVKPQPEEPVEAVIINAQGAPAPEPEPAKPETTKKDKKLAPKDAEINDLFS